jgi:hypothetical protein
VVSNQEAAGLIWAENNQLPLALVMRSARDISRIVITPMG